MNLSKTRLKINFNNKLKKKTKKSKQTKILYKIIDKKKTTNLI